MARMDCGGTHANTVMLLMESVILIREKGL